MKQNSLATWNAVLAISLIALAGTVLAQALLGPPKSKFSASKKRLDEAKIKTAVSEATEKIAKSEAITEQFVWPGDAKLAEAEAMARVTTLAKQHAVSLGAFRPQKATEDAGLRKMPFSLNIDGPYLSIVKFIRDLETTSNRLAVQMLQVSASDSTSDQVSAIMTILVFQRLESPQAAAKQGTAEPASKDDKPAQPVGGGAGAEAAGPKTDVEVTPVRSAAGRTSEPGESAPPK